MSLGLGDIVELQRSYPNLNIDNARGIICKLSYNGNVVLYHIRIPKKFVVVKRLKSEECNVITTRDEIRKIG